MNAHYDPDRTTAESFDYDDREMVREWLEHPNTSALHDDLGRAFRERPAAEQIPELEELVRRNRAMLRELPAEGEHLDELRLELARQVVAAENRIRQLREPSRDEPPPSSA